MVLFQLVHFMEGSWSTNVLISIRIFLLPPLCPKCVFFHLTYSWGTMKWGPLKNENPVKPGADDGAIGMSSGVVIHLSIPLTLERQHPFDLKEEKNNFTKLESQCKTMIHQLFQDKHSKIYLWQKIFQIPLLKLVKIPAADGLVFMNALFATVTRILKIWCRHISRHKIVSNEGRKNPPCTLPIFPLNGFISICTQKCPIVTSVCQEICRETSIPTSNGKFWLSDHFRKE